jgi:flagellar biogenesis protein FliO
MLDLHRPAADARPMARRFRVRPQVRFRRAGIVAGIAMLAFVAFVGAASTLAASGTGHPAAAATGATSAAATVGSAWDTGTGSGIDPIDVIAKAGVVVILLFITLRVLGRMQSGGPKREGRLTVLESRVLAPKASLHLVAVGGRRIVVGLTPSGMVSLAELDASELKEAETELGLAETSTSQSGLGSPAAGGKAPTFATTAGAAILAPVDALAGRIAGLLSGGRAR